MDDRKNPCLLIDCSIRRQGYCVCYEHIRACDAYFLHETAYESFLFRQGTLRKQASQIVDIACHYFHISKLDPPLGEQFFDLMFGGLKLILSFP